MRGWPWAAAGALVAAWLAWASTDRDGLLRSPSADAVERWMVAHPDRVSVVAWSVDDAGARLPAVPHLVHEADAARPAGVVTRLPLALAWASEVVEGRRDAEGPVPLAAWDRWWLPTTDRLAHQDALARLGLAPGEDASVRERDVVAALFRSSDRAAADWLLREVTPGVWGVGWSAPRAGTFVGAALAASNHLAIDDEAPDGLERRWLDDAAFRAAERTWRATAGAPAAHELAPRARAAELAGLVGAIASRAGPDPEAARRVAGLMEWPMDSGRLGGYRSFGGVGDLGPGWVAEVAFSVSDERGTRPARVVVLLLEDVAATEWATLATSLVHQRVVRRLLDDPDHAAALGRRLEEGRAGGLGEGATWPGGGH